ncbi:MAG: heavy metal-binding domain-containing protein [Bacteroidota bacterium]
MKSKMILFPLMIIFVLSMSACGSKTEKFSKYRCPMNCENKTYDKPGTCPVCKMDLEGLPSKK